MNKKENISKCMFNFKIMSEFLGKINETYIHNQFNYSAICEILTYAEKTSHKIKSMPSYQLDNLIFILDFLLEEIRYNDFIYENVRLIKINVEEIIEIIEKYEIVTKDRIFITEKDFDMVEELCDINKDIIEYLDSLRS